MYKDGRFAKHSCFAVTDGVHTETGSELVCLNRFTEIGFDYLHTFTLLIWNRVKLHVIAHVLSAAETMTPFMVVCALLWAKFMLLHHAKNHHERRRRQRKAKVADPSIH